MSGKHQKVYKTAGKFDYQHQYKDILEAAMVSTHEWCNDNITLKHNQSEPTKNPSARKSLCQFEEVLDVKHNTAVCTRKRHWGCRCP